MIKKLFTLALTGIMIMGMGISAFAAETNNLNSSNYIQNIDGTEIDIRKSSVPEGFRLGRSISSDDSAAAGFSTAEEKEGIAARATMPTGGGEYPYQPSYWNDTANIFRANCYGYALNRISNDTTNPIAGLMFQPGYRTGNVYTEYTTSNIITAVKSDMKDLGRTIRSSTYSEKPGSNEYKIALVIATAVGNEDYHWYRQDSDGGWSHKPGLTELTYKDASGNNITDPKTCNRNYPYANYSTWGGYYIISK